MIRFDALPLWGSVALFAAGAAAVRLAGTRLSRYAHAIAARTGIGRAVIGARLLGGITSLPEGATTITALAIGNAPLAVTTSLSEASTTISAVRMRPDVHGVLLHVRHDHPRPQDALPCRRRVHRRPCASEVEHFSLVGALLEWPQWWGL